MTGRPPARPTGPTRVPRLGVLGLLAVLAPSCLPYAVGSTAHTVPPGQIEPTGILYGVPAGIEVFRDYDLGDPDDPDLPLVGFDAEVRFGIDERSDIGVRILPPYGIVGSYKRRLVGNPDGSTPALALTGGLGFVNAFEHLHFEATLTGSGPSDSFTPYGGLRIMQVAPLSAGAVHDTPTVGGFVGVRIGRPGLAILPEVGWYRDESALGVRSGDQIVVWSVGLHGDRLMEAFAVIARLLPLFRP